jgi:hypothetical protein
MVDHAPPIVIVAYNRPRSLKRLLKSISLARYPEWEITLVISIDNHKDNTDVLEMAKEYSWQYGPKEIRYQEINLGLKTHILQCGDYCLDYDSVIILEDDLFVSPNFYFYAIESLEFTKKDRRIGGISLYNHQLNVHTRDHFNALEDGYDNWYFQFASSWGQVWSRDQWIGFREWLSKNSELKSHDTIPRYVLSWSDKSWLKYYITYLIETNRYFFYPKISLTTNFSDAGTHVSADSTIYQVPLLYDDRKTYRFSRLEDSGAVYDAFYENAVLQNKIGFGDDNCCIDLYGYKPIQNERYWLTSKIYNYKIVKAYGRSLKPIEANIIQGVEGTDLFLYDTAHPAPNPFEYDEVRRLLYNIKQISYKQVIWMGQKMGTQKVRRAFLKLKKWVSWS